jgi:hypothetical protein
LVKAMRTLVGQWHSPGLAISRVFFGCANHARVQYPNSGKGIETDFNAKAGGALTVQ